MSQYSNTQRKRVLAQVAKSDKFGRYSKDKERLDRKQIADKFNIHLNTLKDWIRLKKKSEIEKNDLLWKTKIRKMRGSKVLDLEKLVEYVNQNPDMYLEEIAKTFNSNDSTISYWLLKLGFNRKKNKRFTRKQIPKKDKNI